MLRKLLVILLTLYSVNIFGQTIFLGNYKSLPGGYFDWTIEKAHSTVALFDSGGFKFDKKATGRWELYQYDIDGGIDFKIDSTGNITTAGDVSVGDDVLLADGAVVGITGNEVITFNAAGTINVSGAEMHFENNAAAATFGLVTTDADVVLAFDAVTNQGSINYLEDEDAFYFPEYVTINTAAPTGVWFEVTGASDKTAASFVVNSATVNLAIDNSTLELYNPNTTNSNYVGIGFNSYDGANKRGFAAIQAQFTDHTTGAVSGELVFSTAHQAAGITNRLRLESDGDLTWGAADDHDYILKVDANTNDGTITYMEDEDRFDFDNDVLIGGLSGIGFDVFADANGKLIEDPSDIKFKKNIKNINGALEMVMKLKGRHYDWKNGAPALGSEYGLIAQEVAKVSQDLTVYGDHLGIKSRGLIALLVEAIKEQQKEIGKLKKKFNEK
jgi:hypothetical protein